MMSRTSELEMEIVEIVSRQMFANFMAKIFNIANSSELDQRYFLRENQRFPKYFSKHFKNAESSWF